MADNVTIDQGADVAIAAQDEAGVYYQEVKLTASGSGTTEALSKAEDSAHTSGHHGIMALGVRNDTPGSLAGTDGDYVPLQFDSAGNARVTLATALPAGTAAIGKLAANSGIDIGDVDVTSVIPGTGATNLGKATDAAAGANDVGVAPLAIRDDSLSTLTPAEGDWVPLRVNSTGALHVTGGGGGTQYQEDAAHSSGDTGTLALVVRKDTGASLCGTDGDYTGLQVDASGNLRVVIAADDVGSAVVDEDGSVAVGGTDVAQTVAVQYEYDGSALVRVRGDHTVAHDAADAGNPPKIGAKAETSLAGVTLVADGDRTDLYAGVDGVLFTRPHCGLEDIIVGNASNTDGNSTEVIAAAGAGIKQYLTSCTIINASADTFAYVELKSGSTVKWRFPVPPSSGVTHSWNVPLPPNAANEAWNFDPSASVTTLYCSLNGFKSKV